MAKLIVKGRKGMNHKNKIVGLVIIMCMLLIIACGRPGAGTDVVDETLGEHETADEIYEEEQSGELTTDETTEEDSETSGDISGEGDNEEGPTNIVLYQTDDEGMGLIASDKVIEYLSPENVVQLLINQGELAPGVRVLSFVERGAPGQKQLELDLSREFSDFIGNQGTFGEFVVLGSIVNTFLSAFEGESIIITVEGEVLSTPHMGDVTEPLGRFDIW